MFTELFDKLCYIEKISNNDFFVENWGHISFTGIYDSQNTSYFTELYDELVKLNIEGAISYYIGTVKKDLDVFIEEIYKDDCWKININKNVLINTEIYEVKYNFFYSSLKLIDWIKGSNPFSIDFPLNNIKSIHIVVNGVVNNFGGGNFTVCNSDFDCSNKPEFNLWENYDENLILDSLHTIGNSKLIVKPLNHYVFFGKIDEVSNFFYKNSILILLASLSNDLYEEGTIILRGYRRIPLSLGLDYIGTEISAEYQEKLANAVKWIYQSTERCDLRLKLLLERITLDIDYSLPFIQGLFPIIHDATNQAKERYSFIIYDRKDLYQKELKDLLKDLKSISELYSNKLRSLLSNLLRDVLAAFILVGITLFSKTTEITQLFENKLIKYVFVAFGAYFIISAIFQATIDSFDIDRSNKEFDYWKNISREYMSQKEFISHKSNTLNKRMIGTIIIYIIVFLCYIGIGVICFNFSDIWTKIFY